jgi:ElaB/YqjD/DUF883 family membrane-anchored ribosome-binding protein
MPTIDERMGVVETKIQHINEKIDDIKIDLKDVHDCIDRTRDILDKKLDEMLDEYRLNRERYYKVLDDNKQESMQAHKILQDTMQAKFSSIDELEKFKKKILYFSIAITAFLAGAGYLTSGEIAKIVKLVVG